MNSFNKMVQNKRAKMLILTIVLTIALFVRQSTSINLTYIVKKEGAKLQPNCIAEENERYSAIGWIYPIPTNEEEEPGIITKFIPTIQNDFNCKFSKQDKCNKIWALKNWEVDENSTRTLDLLFDTRWEDFPVISTRSGKKEFEERIEIPNTFKAGFSLRASESVELLLCEGWNPYSYPCYHLNLTTNEIFLRKYATLPKNLSTSDIILDSYKAVANILSDDEWRNFIINLDDNGVISLIDVSVNRTVIQYEDKEALKTLYLLVRSEEPALWKIHQNQFFYTKTPQISRLGPILNLPSRDMCVALYVSACPTCRMSFFVVKNNERKFLMDVEPAKNFQWRLIKLKDDHIAADKLNIFVETKFTTDTNETEGFWAVDDVRVCHENEVKLTYLKLEDNEENYELADFISCQVVQHPKWRPKKLLYSKIKDFPTIDNSPNSTSIFLNWTQEDPNNQINYFITYEANDLCPAESPNLERVKSNGFLMTKHNEITINNLIPYTRYNVTFSSMLHENEKQVAITTQESEQPKLEELPSKLNIQVTDSNAYVSWDKISCTSTYGHVLYSMKVTNLKTNTTKELDIQTENTVEINDLQPYTRYTLNIATARNFEDIQNKKSIDMSTDFTTLPGKAPPVKNLELYSKDKNSVSFRYDLPKNSKGVPVYVQVTRCNALSLKKCKHLTLPITPCKLWPKKYCVDINNLIPLQKYTFEISIRNEGTTLYGDELKIETVMEEQQPSAPTNITYQIVECGTTVDYCHLNVTWLHPYDQNGTITSFGIVLNGSDDGTTKSIQEILPIGNSSNYVPRYEYQIKYIPFGTHYELYVQSINSMYKSQYSHTHVKTDNIGDHIDQSPVLLDSHATSVTFKLPLLDHRLKSYRVTTIVQDFDQDVSVDPQVMKIPKVADHLCHNFGKTWVLPQLDVTTNDTNKIDIGPTDEYLQPKTQYCFTFIVTNNYKDTEHDVVYYKKLTTTEKPVSITQKGFNHLYMLLLLLLLVPVGFLAYRYFKKRPGKPRQQENKENVYESLPFEECEENCVNNDTYDQLLHK